MKKLTLLFSILLYSTITWAQGIAGTWNGELNLGTIKLPLVFHIGDNDCTLDSPNQGAKLVIFIITCSVVLLFFMAKVYNFVIYKKMI